MPAILVPQRMAPTWRLHGCNFVKIIFVITRLWKTLQSYNLDTAFLSACSLWFCSCKQTVFVTLMKTANRTFLKTSKEIFVVDLGKQIAKYFYLDLRGSSLPTRASLQYNRVNSCGSLEFTHSNWNRSGWFLWLQSQPQVRERGQPSKTGEHKRQLTAVWRFTHVCQLLCHGRTADRFRKHGEGRRLLRLCHRWWQ